MTSVFTVDTGLPIITNGPLFGLSSIVQFRMGQSNDTSHTENGYRTTIGGRWNGVDLDTNLPQKNAMGYAQKKLQESHALPFFWTKYAIGGQQLEVFSPGGIHHAVLLEREDLLWQEYGKIDLVTMFIGETDAGAGTTQAQYEAKIYAFIDGLNRSPTCFLAIGPLNMNDVPNSQEEAIRDAYRAVATARSDFFFCDLTSITDDFDINNHHIDRESTADAASDLIVASILSLF